DQQVANALLPPGNCLAITPATPPPHIPRGLDSSVMHDSSMPGTDPEVLGRRFDRFRPALVLEARRGWLGSLPPGHERMFSATSVGAGLARARSRLSWGCSSKV